MCSELNFIAFLSDSAVASAPELDGLTASLIELMAPSEKEKKKAAHARGLGLSVGLQSEKTKATVRKDSLQNKGERGSGIASDGKVYIEMGLG